jgi:predicted nucleic acid-binding protein
VLGIDTAPLIYFVERDPAFVDVMRELLRRIDAGILRGFSSVVTLTEILSKPKQAGLVELASACRDILLKSRNFTLVPIDALVAERAADLRARYNLRTPDAFQIAAALHAGCEGFLTNDRALQRVTEPRILMLADLQL